MTLEIYNSLTRKKEAFKPLNPPQVKMYVCGPTVYDEPHIGHLRSAFVFDVMRRYLESDFCNYQVNFIRNVTDVDDKIIEKAKQSGATNLIQETQDVSKKYYAMYCQALSDLGVKAPTRDPHATEHIDDMKKLIKTLMDNQSAYAVGGDVYFDVNKFKDYGSLSGQKRDWMLEGVRIDPSEKKKNPLDFALWKEAKEGEPTWDGPIAGKKGRPGWHIECSAMSMKYLGQTLDIHGGGRDLIFPHHENEIAQSQAVTGKKFANYWIHHGLVTIKNQKMSKSLKNYVTLESATKNNFERKESLKLLFLGTHYSAPLDYSDEHMAMQEAIRNRFYLFFEHAKSLASGVANLDSPKKNYDEAFSKAMNDDFNTPQALTVLHEMVSDGWKEKDSKELLAIAQKIKKFGSIFGLFENLENYLSQKTSLDSNLAQSVENKIKSRAAAKQNKNFKLADEIRKQLLAEEGIELIDKPDGTTSWRRV